METTKTDVHIAGEHLVLLKDKCIYLPDHDLLLVADLHFGKVTHFRKHGIAIPAGAAYRGIEALQDLIEAYTPEKLVFLGDLFHSNHNDAWMVFRSMLDNYPEMEAILIIGNHDILDADAYTDMTCVPSMDIGKLILTHEPMDTIPEERYNLCGHIHPAVRLRGKGRQYLRLPCYYFGREMGILPSFGHFTGSHVLKPMEGDRVFVVDGDCVMEVTG